MSFLMQSQMMILTAASDPPPLLYQIIYTESLPVWRDFLQRTILASASFDVVYYDRQNLYNISPHGKWRLSVRLKNSEGVCKVAVCCILGRHSVEPPYNPPNVPCIDKANPAAARIRRWWIRILIRRERLVMLAAEALAIGSVLCDDCLRCIILKFATPLSSRNAMVYSSLRRELINSMLNCRKT